MPPSMVSSAPVMSVASSDASKTASAATSSGSPKRCHRYPLDLDFQPGRLKRYPKTTRMETAQARRQLIVGTAAACFIEQGFHQTSIRDIAKRAGVSLGNLYNHFENKAALIAEIAMLEERDLDTLEEQVSRISDPSKAFDKLVTLYIAYCCRSEKTMLAAEIGWEGLRNPEVGAGFVQNRSKLNAVIAALITELPGRQGARSTVSPAACADFVVDLIEGLTLRSAFENRQPNRTEIGALKAIIQKIVLN
jgi:AcrR family transcriptional regulator